MPGLNEVPAKRPSFQEILEKLFAKTNKVLASFSSKMLQMLDPDFPIWDSIVLRSLGLVASEKKGKEKIMADVTMSLRIAMEYHSHLCDPSVVAAINDFDKTFPSASRISEVRKLDFILWSNKTGPYASVLDLSKAQDDLLATSTSEK